MQFSNVRSVVILTIVAALIHGRTALGQRTWHINAANCRNGADGTEDDPLCRVQDAVFRAGEGDTVLVHPGTYKEKIFAPWGHNYTLRSTDGAEVTRLEAPPGSGYPVIRLENGEGLETLITGFTIVNEACRGCDGPGIRIKGAAATISHCVFENNAGDYGGAVDVDPGSVVIDQCRFVNNAARYWGGAVFISGGWRSKITNSEFEGNDSGDGGGACFVSNIDIENCTFMNNRTDWQGGALFVGWSTKISDCIFEGNHSIKAGGAIMSYRGTYDVRSSVFTGNLSGSVGGAIRNEDANAVIEKCVFLNNRAAYDGGAIENISSRSRILRSAFFENRAHRGGAIMENWSQSFEVTGCVFSTNEAYDYGGAIRIFDPHAAFVNNCTIVTNSAGDGGGGVAVSASDYNASTVIDVANTIIFGNTSDGVPSQVLLQTQESLPPRIWQSDIEGSGGSEAWDTSLGEDGGGNIDADPLFVAPDEDNYRLSPDSPCIDAGDNDAASGIETDIDGTERIVNDVVDMGAYEYAPEAVKVTIDVRPKNPSDPVNPSSNGVLSVAILSTEAFDARSVDPSTVQLAGAGVAVRGGSSRTMSIERDVNADQLVDLVVHVSARTLNFTSGNAKLALSGETYDGTPIYGVALVHSVGRR